MSVNKKDEIRKRNLGFSSKGQLSEAVGFTILVISVTFLIIIYRLFIATSASDSLVIISERHEIERLKGGTNAMLFMTEEKSGNTILNLAGIASGVRNDVINFGPVIGEVNVSEEITWRMDALFEKNHWRIVIPFPNATADIQIVIVVDTSGSMNNDIADMSTNLPKLIQQIKDSGRNVQATIYMLGVGQARCNQFPAEIVRCTSISVLDCQLTGSTSEDWGNGMACAARWGPLVAGSADGTPIPGWSDGAARVGIVLSDELSGGSECGGGGCAGACTLQEQSLQNGIDGAIENGVIVFPLKANVDYTPQCSDRLSEWMTRMANETGGEMTELINADQVSETIAEIVSSINVTDISKIEVGSTPPQNIRIRAYDVLVPIPITGEYTKAFIYQWP